MKLVKYRDAHGTEVVGRMDGDEVLPLNMSGRQYNSLFDILEADDPAEVADFLNECRNCLPDDKVTFLRFLYWQ